MVFRAINYALQRNKYYYPRELMEIFSDQTLIYGFKSTNQGM